MHYKALMLDIDGTIIPYEYQALPTQRVKDAIKSAREKGVIVTLVTGRSYPSTKRILDYLQIHDGLAVSDGGALIYDVSTNKKVYEQHIEPDDFETLVTIFTEEGVPFYIKDKTTVTQKGEHFKLHVPGTTAQDVSMIFTDEIFSLEKTHELLKKLSIPTITVLRTRHKDPDKYSFNITHVKATKLHGIEYLSKELGLQRGEIIGCGDGYNDFPLLMASGLKVAMGNAIEDLKEIADYIAPTVDDDGVADLIEKFILSS